MRLDVHSIRSTTRARSAAALLLLATYGCSDSTAVARATGEIAFVSDRHVTDPSVFDVSVYLASADGRDVRRVYHSPRGMGGLSWSPDGTRLAFSGSIPGETGSWVSIMDADGTNVRHLATGRWPTWSRDGERLAFVTVPGLELWIVNADGTDAHVIPNTEAAWDADWSPTSDLIAFSHRTADLREGIFTVLPDGTGLTQLTEDPNDENPAWSPDGTRIAFVSRRPPAEQPSHDNEIYMVDADGSNRRRITFTADVNEIVVRWSPSGHHLVVGTANGELIVMRADGSGARNITSHPALDGWPAWRPENVGP